MDLQQFLQDYQPKPLGQLKKYAVFLPLVWDKGEWCLLYQVRSQIVSQPGEVSFPGGAIEDGELPSQAAVRETMEELNVTKEDILPLGEIDYLVFSSRMIHCFVGKLLVEDWRSLQPNQEVERLFVLPLKILQTPPVYYPLDTKIAVESAFPFEKISHGKKYPFSNQRRWIPFYEQVEEPLWGMTAQMTHHFIELLKVNRLSLETL